MSKTVGPKSPSLRTVKRLFALSGNRCAFPDCQTRLVDPDTGSIIGQVCHIKGEKPAAARYDPNQDDHACHGFDNLILMCNVHHKVIDDNAEGYPVEDLIEMKERHETRQEGKEPIDDAMSQKFTSAVMVGFTEHGDMIQATNVSGGQVAHTIINNAPPPESGAVDLEGRTTISTNLDVVGCPYLTLTVVCRSKRPAKIRRAVISLLDEGIIAALEAGFGESLACTPLPDSREELTVDLFPIQQPNHPAGFVLQQDDAARFLLPALAGPIGLFLIRPAENMSLKVEFFDESEQVVVQGAVLKPQLEDLVRVTKQVPCKPRFPTVRFGVRVSTTTFPEPGPVGKVNPKPIHFGLRVSDPTPTDQTSEVRQEDMPTPWFERTGVAVPYPEIRQGNVPHCVYAAVTGAVNHLMQREVWTPKELFDEHQKNGPRNADFGVGDTALRPVSDEIEQHHHNSDHSTVSLTPSLIREWLGEGAVVILSMELRNDEVSQQGGWHMFTLVLKQAYS